MNCVGFALGLFIATCTPVDTVTGEARYCQLARPLRYSRQDTAETREQLRVANATYRRACGGAR